MVSVLVYTSVYELVFHCQSCRVRAQTVFLGIGIWESMTISMQGFGFATHNVLKGFGPPYAHGFRAEHILLVFGPGAIEGFATRYKSRV